MRTRCFKVHHGACTCSGWEEKLVSERSSDGVGFNYIIGYTDTGSTFRSTLFGAAAFRSSGTHSQIHSILHSFFIRKLQSVGNPGQPKPHLIVSLWGLEQGGCVEYKLQATAIMVRDGNKRSGDSFLR